MFANRKVAVLPLCMASDQRPPCCYVCHPCLPNEFTRYNNHEEYVRGLELLNGSCPLSELFSHRIVCTARSLEQVILTDDASPHFQILQYLYTSHVMCLVSILS